nr:MAG TPA: hypothetical protein [Caudoviricetes sp.]
MKRFFLKNYKKIDSISSTFLLYFLQVWIFNYIFSFITNKWEYIFVVVLLPVILICFKQIRNGFNRLLHRIMGF